MKEYLKICFFILGVFCCSCNHFDKDTKEDLYSRIQGETMGTYYQVTLPTSKPEELKKSIDSLLVAINDEVSVYETDSYISKVNQADSGDIFQNMPKHFAINLSASAHWYEASDGYMDVSIMPLINYWGFGYTPKEAVTSIDSSIVDSIHQLIGLDKWSLDEDRLAKNIPGQQLDFGAIAKGYAVDEIGALLSGKGYSDFLIDIGGEMLARGKSKKNAPWIIGISTPKPGADIEDVQLLLSLENKALASSGNYRIFYEVNGRKYGHTIDPKNGYPYQDQLLAVSIISEKCIDADAIATACMAMGYLKAITFIAQLENVSACFLLGDHDGSIKTKFTNGFIQYVFEPQS